MAKPPFFFLLLLFIAFHPILSTVFVFNGFNSSSLSLYGDTILESRTLTLTNASVQAMGRAFFPSKMPTRSPNSTNLLPFYTSFIFSIAPLKGSLCGHGHGLVFLFSPLSTLQGATSAQHLGLFNITNDGCAQNHVLGVEFDLFRNPEFNDIDDNHVGVDVNSLTSIDSNTAGYWVDGRFDKFRGVKLKNGVNYQVWIDYEDALLNVTMAPAGMRRPRRPLISVSVDLSDVLLDEMYVGFTAATGAPLIEAHRVLAWCFSNSDKFVGDRLITSNLPSFIPSGSSVFMSERFGIGLIITFVVLVLLGCCSVMFRSEWVFNGIVIAHGVLILVALVRAFLSYFLS